MAEDRTNMVSLLDTGSLFSGETPKIVELGDGFKELQEDWGPDVESTQYINMKTKSSTLKGYEFSTTLEREYMSDEVQKTVDKIFKVLPTGKDCETYYYRFYKTDITGNTGECIRLPVVVSANQTGGAGGDVLTSSLQVNGNGDVEVGTVTISEDGTYSWAPKAAEAAG